MSNALLWIAIGCFIVALILFNMLWIWRGRAQKNPERLPSFLRYKTALQIGYFIFFIAAAVCFLLW